jgi:hypothetical protein
MYYSLLIGELISNYDDTANANTSTTCHTGYLPLPEGLLLGDNHSKTCRHFPMDEAGT